MYICCSIVCTQTIVCVSVYIRPTCLSCSGCWSPVCVCGSQPSQRAHHTLTAVDKKRAILFGGYDGEKQLNDVWLFDDERKVSLLLLCVFVHCDCLCIGVAVHHTNLPTVATTDEFTHCVYNGV